MGYNAELIYPQRKRCARCRSYFCWSVIFGLFCSRECAGISAISYNPEEWPRSHYSMVEGKRKAKRSFPSMRSAEKFARRSGKAVYRCGYCWELHIGSPDPGKSYPPHPEMPL